MKTKRIKEIIELTPIITKQNIIEFLRQSEINHFKALNIKYTKKSLNNRINNIYVNHVIKNSVGAFVSEYVDNRIVLNLNNLNKMSYNDNKKEEIFIKNICNCITHETIHKVLQLNEDNKTCEKFDNIYNSLLVNYGVSIIHDLTE